MTHEEQLADTIRPPKPCGCGACYEDDDWKRLAFVGIQDLGDGDRIELRNCSSCSSTLGVLA